jgi:hypothetical protein
MAFDITYFLKINNMYNTTSNKEIELYDLKNQINDRFADTIDCYNIKLNGVNRDLLIIRTKDNYIKTIKGRPDEDFSIGDYVEWEGLKWLITSKDDGNQVYTTGQMQQCNWTIKFQSPTGAILSYPSIVDSKTSGEDDGKVIVTGNSEKYIKLPFDSNTVLLDIDRRLYVDKREKPTPFHIIDVDTIKHNFGTKGLMEFTVKKDLTQNTSEHPDRPDLGICNYFEPIIVSEPVDPTIPTVVVAITSDTESNKVKLGLTYNFIATFKNELGEIVNTSQPHYSIDNTYSGLVVLTDNGDKTCTIKVNEDAYDILTNQFTLTCTDMYSGFSSSILLTIAGLF